MKLLSKLVYICFQTSTEHIQLVSTKKKIESNSMKKKNIWKSKYPQSHSHNPLRLSPLNESIIYALDVLQTNLKIYLKIS